MTLPLLGIWRPWQAVLSPDTCGQGLSYLTCDSGLGECSNDSVITAPRPSNKAGQYEWLRALIWKFPGGCVNGIVGEMNSIVIRPSIRALICSLSLIQCAPTSNQQTYSSSSAQLGKLLSLHNKRLDELHDNSYEELVSFLKSLSPQWKGSAPFSWSSDKPPFHTPRYFWKLSKSDVTRYILLGADGLRIIPGDSRAEVYVVDPDGRLLSYSEFSLGWRAQLKDIELIQDTNFGVPMIEISTVNRPSKQYYALVQDELALVRLEDGGGAIRNKFVAGNWIIGPPVPNRTAAEWEQALLSDDTLENLRTMVWLGGKHWDLKIPPFQRPDGEIEPTPEVRANAELVVNVRARRKVHERLKELSRSENKWISEAAELALKPHDGDTSFCCGYASQ